MNQETMIQSLRNEDEVDVDKLPDHVIDVIVAAFILIGVNEEELNTWQKVSAKLKQMNEEQLINKVRSLKYKFLTEERMDLAKDKLNRAGGEFEKFGSVQILKKQCLETIFFYQHTGGPRRKDVQRISMGQEETATCLSD